MKAASATAKPRFQLPITDQILLTLMRLHLGLLLVDLGHRFSISSALASRISLFWIEHLAALSRKYLVLWLPKETIRKTLPPAFKHFQRATCIVDCFEICIDRPGNLLRRGKTYSHYKSHNTSKVLHVIAPNGFIIFVSPAYGGRASDRFITKNSGFLQCLQPGDEVLADRGFTIAELLPRGVKIMLPSFTKGRQLDPKDIASSRRLAKIRIHVERSIRRMKCFRILRYLPATCFARKNSCDDILMTVAGLCNLQPMLIRGQRELLE